MMISSQTSILIILTKIFTMTPHMEMQGMGIFTGMVIAIPIMIPHMQIEHI
jgi:hypothetical protein